MTPKKSFFADQGNEHEIREHATSFDTTLRWSAAIELSEIDKLWAAEQLWSMREDPDEYVREIAEKGIRNFSPEVLDELAGSINVKFGSDVQGDEDENPDDGVLRPYLEWKTRPLDPPSKDNEWIIGAAVTDIVSVEGPITGARILRLYGQSVYPNAPKKINRYRVKVATQQMIERSRVVRVDNTGSDELEDWILVRFGFNQTAPRERGLRRVDEIPVSEISSTLQAVLGLRARRLSRDKKFEEILKIYQIQPNEYHLVGAALEKQWVSLLAPAS